MIRLDRIALAAGGLLARAALGLIALAILIGWNGPMPETASSRPDDPADTATTVTLRVPDGALAKHLTVVDATGRELAILTHWISGITTVVSRRRDRAGVSYLLNPDGSARLRVSGTARETLIDADREGTTRVLHQIVLPVGSPGPSEAGLDPDPRSPIP